MAISTINQNGLNAPLTLTSPVLTTPSVTGGTFSSPTMTTPALGTPSAINLTNATALPKAALPTGSILQIVQATYSTEGSVSSTVNWTTLATTTITPSSASSKILVRGYFIGQVQGSGNMRWIGGLYRSSTQLITAAVGPINASNSGGSYPCYMEYLDSPSSTSSLTYSVQVRCYDGSFGFTVCPNGSINPSIITLMEVAG